MRITGLLLVISLFALMVGCTSKDAIKSTIENNPEILFNVIEKNPDKFMEVVNKAVQTAQVKQRENAAKAEEQERDEEIKNPKKPELSDDRVAWGPKDAPITIVEYSDFQCPYCSRGYTNLKEVEKRYPGKIRVVYKHLPLDFHPKAMPAAEWFEAIALQDKDKAHKFHDEVFEHQDKLQGNHEQFFTSVAKKLGVDVSKVKADLKSEKVKSHIEADMAEARKFGFQGTPGFLINGVSLRGAYPPDEFAKIIDKELGTSKK